jgi:hypothetical protein
MTSHAHAIGVAVLGDGLPTAAAAAHEHQRGEPSRRGSSPQRVPAGGTHNQVFAAIRHS